MNRAVLLCGISLFFWFCNQNGAKTETGNTAKTEEHSGSGMAAEGNNSNKMMELMHENMTTIQEADINGDPDHDFALLMAKHHEGAIKMAEEEAANGTDSTLVNLAKQTITKQKEEQQVLQAFADNQREAPKDTANTQVLLQPMKNMMAKMGQNTNASTDHHFASLMSMHHQSGIEMARAYIPVAKVPEIRSRAQKIINDQQQEKAMLDKWLQNNKQ
nr:DUF305 domain-containing protein [Sabulibacter ruber]